MSTRVFMRIPEGGNVTASVEITDLFTDLERADCLAAIEELQLLRPQAHATVTDTNGDRIRVLENGEPISASKAIAMLEALVPDEIDEGEVIL